MKRGMLTWRHRVFMLLRFVGMRDRLRCPRCSAIGTWKPHGGHAGGGPRRWLCKCCGLYIGPEGERQAHPDGQARVWHTTQGLLPQQTPFEMLMRHDYSVWPWVG